MEKITESIPLQLVRAVISENSESLGNAKVGMLASFE